MHAFRKFAVAGVLVAGLAAVALPNSSISQAQGGLSDEDIASLDRVYAMLETSDSYTSYHSETTRSDSQTLIMTINGETSERGQTNTVTESKTIIRNDLEDESLNNIQATAVLDIVAVNDGTEVSATINADILYVDQILYMNAQGEGASDFLNGIVEGWQAYDSEEAVPEGFDSLKPDSYFGDNEDNPFEDREYILPLISSIAVEPSELEDGTAVDIITITIDGEGFYTFYTDLLAESEEENPLLGIITPELLDGTIIYSITVDAENTPIAYNIDLTMTIAEFDLSLIAPNVPEDSLVSIIYSQSEESFISEANAEFSPAVAPELE